MATEVAKAILAGGQFKSPMAGDGAALFQLAMKLGPEGQADAWYAAIDDADTGSLIFIVGALTRGFESKREAARSMVERKLNAEMLAKMRDLERASVRLQWVAIGVALAIAAVQIVVAVCGR